MGTWEAKRLGDGSFLKNGAERDWGFEDIEIADGKVSILAALHVCLTDKGNRSYLCRSYHTPDSRARSTTQMSP